MLLFSSNLSFPAPNCPMSTDMSAWRNSFQKELQPAAGGGKSLNLTPKSRSSWESHFTHLHWQQPVLITPSCCHQVGCVFLFTHYVFIKSASVLSYLGTSLFCHICDRSVLIILVFLHLPPDRSGTNSSDDNGDNGFCSDRDESLTEHGFENEQWEVKTEG